MLNFDEQIKALYDYYGVSNDNQLSKKLGYTSNSALVDWRKKQKIPAKYLLNISMNRAGAIAIGSQNIAINGDNNALNHQNDITNTPKFKEFLELFTKYGNDATLDGFIKKLNALKEIS
ncbi:hypothetical protein [Campylobacter majalis]|uniref:hypothetical protein n=1 Tax=Campylobacter majalis TaxID=2790656 RepID=UPI003D695AE6